MRKLVAFLAIFLIVPGTSASADEIRDRQYWLSEYGFDQAWQTTRGEGVVVAIIDTGIDASHPALRGAVIGGTDVSGLGSEDGLTPVGTNSYHGTMVASLLAGRGDPNDSGAGVIGVAPEVKLLSVSMAFGVDGLDTDSQIARGIVWAVDNGAQVINLSLTRNSTSWPASWDEAFLYAFENDVVIVAATGNRSDGTEQISAPATIPGVVSVSGLRRNGEPSEKSALSGFSIAVTAPAEELIGAYPGGEIREWSGTSGAAPIVAGLVALIRSQYPELDAANVVNRLIATATKNGFSGYSPKYGYGAINAELALSSQVPEVSENPLGSLSSWIELYRKLEGQELPGEIVAPLAIEELNETEEPFESSIWLPVAGYAGLGLLAWFLYLAFRPQPKNQRKVVN